MERQQRIANSDRLKGLQGVEPPWFFGKNYKEFWREGYRYRAGFVVGMLVDRECPITTIVFFDAGRRRSSEGDGSEGIVLDARRVTTAEVISGGISIGDLVKKSGTLRSKLEKVASPDDLERQGVTFPESDFDWDRVIGVLY